MLVDDRPLDGQNNRLLCLLHLAHDLIGLHFVVVNPLPKRLKRRGLSRRFALFEKLGQELGRQERKTEADRHLNIKVLLQTINEELVFVVAPEFRNSHCSVDWQLAL